VPNAQCLSAARKYLPAHQCPSVVDVVAAMARSLLQF
jgi:hypothetical protein